MKAIWKIDRNFYREFGCVLSKDAILDMQGRLYGKPLLWDDKVEGYIYYAEMIDDEIEVRAVLREKAPGDLLQSLVEQGATLMYGTHKPSC